MKINAQFTIQVKAMMGFEIRYLQIEKLVPTLII